MHQAFPARICRVLHCGDTAVLRSKACSFICEWRCSNLCTVCQRDTEGDTDRDRQQPLQSDFKRNWWTQLLGRSISLSLPTSFDKGKLWKGIGMILGIKKPLNIWVPKPYLKQVVVHSPLNQISEIQREVFLEQTKIANKGTSAVCSTW